ncbi:MAG: MinD/ParA family protein [Pseudomonadota bacterium]
MKTISITSGKGGVGKSIVSVNLGLALAKDGKRVLLFDADLSLANIDILFGLNCEYNLSDVIAGSKEIDEILIEPVPGLKVLPASSGVLKLARLDQAQLVRIAIALQELAKDFDTLLIDTGAGLNEPVLFFNSSVDEVLVVTTPDPTAMTDAYALIKILNSNYELKSAVVLVNQVENTAEGAHVFHRLKSVCRKYLTVKLVDGGCLLKDPMLGNAVRNRKPVFLSYPNSPISRQFCALARRHDELFSSTSNGLTKDFWGKLLTQQFGKEE